MSRRHRFFLACGLLALTALPVRSAAATTRAELDDRARRAGEVFRELRQAPDGGIPDELLARSRCVAVVPNVITAAWVLGGRYGRGLLSCRSKAGEWSPPVHVLMTGGSFGLQFGASSTDVVLFFMTTGSVRSLLLSKVKLSGEASIAAGPVGRETAAATDARFTAEIYTYARSRGLFAGVSFSGGYLGVQREDTNAYYGTSYSPVGVLFEHKVTSVPKSAWTFLGALPQPRGKLAGAQAPAAAATMHAPATATAPLAQTPPPASASGAGPAAGAPPSSSVLVGPEPVYGPPTR